MGAQDFTQTSKGDNVYEAFINARDEASWDHGHGGYTGTIAEKLSFKLVDVPEGMTPQEFIDDCFADENHFCQDKWGDAAAVKIAEGAWTFFGWASC